MAEFIFPYELPTNWQWATLGDVCEYIKAGGDKPKDFSKCKTKSCNVPVVANGIINNGIIGYTSKPKEKSGTITVSGRGTIGYSVLRDYNYYPIVRVIILSTNEKIFSHYLKFVIDYSSLQGIGSSIPQLTIPMLKKFPIPLPPLDEQKRIVAVIESLFEKLDAAKSIVQKILDGYELRRAAFLHKAFTGELTKNFRAEHGFTLDDWQQKKLGDMFILKAGKNISATEISPVQNDTYQYPCFGGNGIRGFVGRYNREGKFPIIGRQGALCGNIKMATGKFYATEHAVVVTYKCEMDSVFAENYLSYLNLNQYATATAQPGLAVSKILNVQMKYLPIAEQKEIVRVLESLLEKEQRTKEIAEKILSEIDVMKRTILARAFRGELGTKYQKKFLEGL